MEIYLDTCCYGRPFDKQKQAKIAAEAISVMTAIDICKTAKYDIVGSEAVIFEIGRIRDDILRENVKAFYDKTVTNCIFLTSKDRERAAVLRADGLGDMDSVHLAAAEAAGVKFLLTTDVDFERICAEKKLSSVKVINPLTFLTEVIT